MSTTVVVPDHMVGHLRSGLYTLIGDAAEELSRIVETRNRELRPESYEEPLEHLDRARALLNVIGWEATEPTASAHVALREHQRALMNALNAALLIATQEREEADAVDAERARQGEPPTGDVALARFYALRLFVSSVETEVDELHA
jgi:hypothetical protein